MKTPHYFATLAFGLCLILIGFIPQDTYADEAKQKLERLMSSPPDSNISSNTWKAALTSYFSACKEGECKCLLLVSEKKSGITHYMWAGKIAGSSAQTKFANHGGMMATNVPGKGSGWDKSYNDSLPTCTTGNATVANGDGGDGCCATDSSGADKCFGKCTYYQDRADALGIPKDRRHHRIYYRSTLEGVFYLHEEAAKCKGLNQCGKSFGCVRIYAQAMKSLCEDHIGMTAEATGRAFPANGGAYLYFQNMQSLKRGDMNSAAQGLTIYERKCGNTSMSALSDSPINRGYSPAFNSGGNEASNRTARSQSTSRGSSSDGFLAAFFKFLFGGGGGTGPAAQSTGAYQQLAENNR